MVTITGAPWTEAIRQYKAPGTPLETSSLSHLPPPHFYLTSQSLLALSRGERAAGELKSVE
jgi:hypothetical protein